MPVNETSPEEGWSAVITSKKPLLHIPVREIWKYRDLILLMVRRDLIAAYKQTVLGPFWLVIQPLISGLVFTVIFNNVIGIETNSIPPFLFNMSGILIWYYLSACLTTTSQTFSGGAALFTKVYFPRLSVPVSTAIVNFCNFLIQVFIFLVFYIYFYVKGAPIEPNYRVIIIPLLVIQTAMLGIGIGCVVASLTTRFKDLQIAIAPGLQLWMYASCIFYPRTTVPEQWQWVMSLNPIVPVIETFRFAIMGQGQVEISQWFYSFIFTVFIFFFGLVEFGRAEKNFADTI